MNSAALIQCEIVTKLIQYQKLIRSKIPSSPMKRPRRIIPGMTKCNKCPICPFVQEGKSVRSTVSNYTVDINQPVNCQTRNILYCISCAKCSIQYVGESERTLQDRFSEHKGYAINQKVNKAKSQKMTDQGS